MAAEKPLCSICGQHQVSQKGAAACHSPRCKRKLAEERAAMAKAKNRVQALSKKKLEKAHRRVTRPDKLRREAAEDVERWMAHGYSSTEAVWKTAGNMGMTPAEVMHACRERGDAA